MELRQNYLPGCKRSQVLVILENFRRGTQVVRERSAKPLRVGSIPTRASKSCPVVASNSAKVCGLGADAYPLCRLLNRIKRNGGVFSPCSGPSICRRFGHLDWLCLCYLALR